MGVVIHLLCAAISMISRVECSDLSFVIDMDEKNYYSKRELRFNLNMTELVDLEYCKLLSHRKDVPFNQVSHLSLRIRSARVKWLDLLNRFNGWRKEHLPAQRVVIRPKNVCPTCFALNVQKIKISFHL